MRALTQNDWAWRSLIRRVKTSDTGLDVEVKGSIYTTRPNSNKTRIKNWKKRKTQRPRKRKRVISRKKKLAQKRRKRKRVTRQRFNCVAEFEIECFFEELDFSPKMYRTSELRDAENVSFLAPKIKGTKWRTKISPQFSIRGPLTKISDESLILVHKFIYSDRQKFRSGALYNGRIFSLFWVFLGLHFVPKIFSWHLVRKGLNQFYSVKEALQPQQYTA